MGNRSYPKLVDGLESADDDGSVQGANRAISASLTADSIQKEPGKFVERTAWLFVIISCLDGLDSDLLFQLIKFFNYLHTFLDKPKNVFIALILDLFPLKVSSPFDFFSFEFDRVCFIMKRL